jgi:uncharacterized spore protein YtfJ
MFQLALGFMALQMLHRVWEVTTMVDVLQSIIEPLQKSAAVHSVFGEPVTAQGKTVIPVARIAYGFGGGAGKSVNQEKPGEGQGGGGGVAAVPVGVFELTDKETRFVPMDETRKLMSVGLLGLGLGLLWAGRKRHGGS